jgi:hypothetical protein
VIDHTGAALMITALEGDDAALDAILDACQEDGWDYRRSLRAASAVVDLRSLPVRRFYLLELRQYLAGTRKGVPAFPNLDW